MNRFSLPIVLVVAVLASAPAAAQQPSGGTVRVTQTTAVLENPRGDSVVVGSAPSGLVLDVVEERSGWYLVTPQAEDAPNLKWKRGWVQARFVQVQTPGAVVQPSAPTRPGAPAPRSAPAAPNDPLLIRGFGLAGGTLFTARDSFDTILGSAFGGVFGGGAQVAFGNGLYAQVAVDRFRKTGSRALISGEQIFRLGIDHVIEVTPLQVTVGYRDPRAVRTVGYFGGGIGSHALKETTADLPDADVDDTHIGYHVVGGAEFRMTSFLWLAGEVQWSAVPDAMGERGVSAAFAEDDLGGTTFRFKILFGR
jgi:hypothetical protein